MGWGAQFGELPLKTAMARDEDGGQSCAVTLSACVAGTCRVAMRLAPEGSAAPALRWAAEFSQRENCHQNSVKIHPVVEDGNVGMGVTGG